MKTSKRILSILPPLYMVVSLFPAHNPDNYRTEITTSEASLSPNSKPYPAGIVQAAPAALCLDPAVPKR